MDKEIAEEKRAHFIK